MYPKELNTYPDRWLAGRNLLKLFLPHRSKLLMVTSFSTQKKFMAFWLGSQVTLALSWFILSLGGGLHSSGLLVATFLLITLFNFTYYLSQNISSSFCKIQGWLLLITIIGLHISSGGLGQSSFVLVVSLFPILGLLLQRGLTGYQLSGLLAILVFLVAIDPIWDGHNTTAFSTASFFPFLVINLAAFIGLPMGLLFLYMQSEDQTKKQLELKEERLAVEFSDLTKRSTSAEKSLDKQQQALRYASRIQSALYPAKEELSNFFSDSFILNHPKDFVSGDFYWCSNQVDRFILVLGDCTGHGVSGGFLTILGSSILNQLVNETGISAPGILLRSLDMRLSSYLHQGIEACDKRVSDGMDLAVLVFDKASSTLQFAGAKQGLWVLSNRDWQYIKGDRIPIGHSERYQSKRWATHTIPFQKGDRFYLSTDGYRDQFGGEQNMKFGRLQMESLLHAHEASPLETTEEVLEAKFQAWKGKQAQTDDVLVMGVEV